MKQPFNKVKAPVGAAAISPPLNATNLFCVNEEWVDTVVTKVEGQRVTIAALRGDKTWTISTLDWWQQKAYNDQYHQGGGNAN